MRISIIEDDHSVREALKMVLGQLGHSVKCYENAEAFLDVLALGQEIGDRDVVIIDLGLPGLSGTSIITMLRQNECHCKIIVISGQPQNRIKQSLQGLGPLIVLRKPLSADKILANLS